MILCAINKWMFKTHFVRSKEIWPANETIFSQIELKASQIIKGLIL